MKTILALASVLALASCADTSSTTTAATSGSVKPYTKDVCVVSGNKLGSMGRPITKTYGNQQVKFCCKPCETKFEKDPARYLAKAN